MPVENDVEGLDPKREARSGVLTRTGYAYVGLHGFGERVPAGTCSSHCVAAVAIPRLAKSGLLGHGQKHGGIFQRLETVAVVGHDQQVTPSGLPR